MYNESNSSTSPHKITPDKLPVKSIKRKKPTVLDHDHKKKKQCD